jgi:hypothetical protein
MKVEPVILEGNFVRLEPMRIGHHQQLCEVGLDEDLWRISPDQIVTPDDMLHYIETALAEQNRGVSIPFVTIENLQIKLSAPPVSVILPPKTVGLRLVGLGLPKIGKELMSTPKPNY